MRKLISVLSVMLIVFASVWAMIPVMAADLPVAPESGAQDVGVCDIHTFGAWSVETGATCTVHSYHTRICTVCQFAEVEKVAEKLGHTAGAYTFDADKGTHTYVCATCNETLTENCTLELIGSQPECATAVTNTYKCAVCQNTCTKSEPATHNVSVWTPVENSIQHAGVCAGCEQTVTEDCVFEETSVTANCITGGKRILQCKCGRTIDEDVPALGHHVETWLHIEGTSIHAGTCTRCLASPNNSCTVSIYTANTIGADGAITHSGSCDICLAPYTEECTKGNFVSVAGTASHQTACTDCARPFTEFCKADENGLTSNNNGTHSATCAVCKSLFTVACTPTEFTHVENTETHSTACSVCGGSYNEACTVSTWKPTVKIDLETGVTTDENLHTGNCDKCSEAYEKACKIEAYTLDAANKICTGTCTVCSDTVKHESTLSDWSYDGETNTHNVTCTVCKTTASHTVTVADNAWKHVEENDTHRHEGACTVCSTDVDSACVFEKDATDVHKLTCKVCAYSYDEECTSFKRDKENSTSATCTEKGYTYYYCSDCGERNESKTLEHAALGHKFVQDPDSEVTAADDSHTVTYICQNEGCTHTETKTEEHAFADAKAEKDGKHTVTCTVCGKTETETCKAEKIPAVAATCTKTGLSEGSKCSVCGTVLKEQTVTSARGHDYKFSSTTATCSKAGKDIFKCVCGETKEMTAAANGKHDWKETKRVAATASANGYVQYTCKNCTATYNEVLVYSVNTGVGSALTPVAAIVLLSGAAFLGVKKLRKEED